MIDQKSKFMVGLFMAGGIGIALVAVIWLGMSRYFEKGKYYASYFDESVQGLNVDSPVKYRGVAIGRVERIEVAPDSRLITVIMKIESDVALEHDMTAQLKVVGITGSMFIEIDRMYPGEPVLSPKLNFPSEYPIVASKPSDISKLFRGLDDVIQQLSSLDLEGVSNRAKTTLDSMNNAVGDLDAAGISTELKVALNNLNKDLDNEKWTEIIRQVGNATSALESILSRVDGIVAKNEKNIQTSIAGLQQAVGNMNTFTKKASATVDGTNKHLAELTDQYLTVGRNLEEASANLNRSLGLLADQPAQLLFGTAPPPKPVAPWELTD